MRGWGRAWEAGLGAQVADYLCCTILWVWIFQRSNAPRYILLLQVINMASQWSMQECVNRLFSALSSAHQSSRYINNLVSTSTNKICSSTNKSVHQPIKSIHQTIKSVQPIKSVHQPVKSVHQPVKSVHQPIKSVYQPMKSAHKPIKLVHQQS